MFRYTLGRVRTESDSINRPNHGAVEHERLSARTCTDATHSISDPYGLHGIENKVPDHRLSSELLMSRIGPTLKSLRFRNHGAELAFRHQRTYFDHQVLDGALLRCCSPVMGEKHVIRTLDALRLYRHVPFEAGVSGSALSRLGRHEAHGLASLDWNGRGFETMSI